MEPRYIFVHVPKNGGSTLHSILENYYGRQYLPMPEPRPGYILSDREKREIIQENPHAKFFGGHSIRYPAPQIPGTEFNFVTILRHPIERLVSLYAYERKMRGATHSSQRSMDEWIDIRLKEDNALRNYQAFHVMGVTNEGDVSLEAAKEIIDRYKFVGILEDFDASLVLLAAAVNMPIEACRYTMKNVTKSKQIFKLDPSTEERLRKLNSIDMDLYDYAAERFAQEKEAQQVYVRKSLRTLSRMQKGETGGFGAHVRRLISTIRSASGKGTD